MIHIKGNKTKGMWVRSEKVAKAWKGVDLVYKSENRYYLFNRGQIFEEASLTKGWSYSIIEYRDNYIYSQLPDMYASGDMNTIEYRSIEINNCSSLELEIAGVLSNTQFVRILVRDKGSYYDQKEYKINVDNLLEHQFDKQLNGTFDITIAIRNQAPKGMEVKI